MTLHWLAEATQKQAADKTMQELLAADEESKLHTAEGAQKKAKKKKKVCMTSSMPLLAYLQYRRCSMASVSSGPPCCCVYPL